MADVEKMRADFVAAMKWFKWADGWTDAHCAEANAAIKAAIAQGDAHIVQCWADWLADYAARWCAWVTSIRALEVECRRLAREDNAALAAAEQQRINQSKGQRYDGSGVRNAA